MSSSLKVLYPRGLDLCDFLTNDTCEQKVIHFVKYPSFLWPIVYFCLADKNQIT